MQRNDSAGLSRESIANTIGVLRERYAVGLTTTYRSRITRLNALLRMLDEHRDDVLNALSNDLGKPRLEALMMEWNVVRSEIVYAIKKLDSWVRQRKINLDLALFPAKAYQVAEPLGLVLIISPWNYPFQLAMLPLIGAIAAGNTVLLKPSEMAPHTSAFLAKYLPIYLNDATAAVALGGVVETQVILEHQFDHIFFTGSGAVGKEILKAAAEHLTPCTLELGGKSPCIVSASANLYEAAKKIVWGKFVNAGQTCIAPDYIYVESSVKQELLSHLKSVIKSFYGDNPKSSSDYGRIINAKHFARLQNLLCQSGQVYYGGDYSEEDLYISPTILTGCDLDSPIMQPDQEIFGPILPVLEYQDIDSVIQEIRSRPKPLTLYVFTASQPEQDQLACSISSGSLMVNHTLLQASQVNLPFGGVGASGMSSYHGEQSFKIFSHFKSVMIKPDQGLLPDAAQLLYPPATEVKEKLLELGLKYHLV